MPEGIVVKASGGFYTVHTPDGEWVCRLPGRLKRERSDTDLVAVGERVRVDTQRRSPRIVEILPRRSKLSRRAP
ncbi:MAG TPA: ribosome small subunit-dependent GTPase, partial [Anaerolineae bacterium]|nr:ribosome small subunit-dependent GTPase [Anaerolineae bacterium]